MRKSSSRIYYITALLLMFIVSGILGISVPVSAEAQKTDVFIFYDNACAACREDVELEEVYRENVPLELREKYQLRIYNIFQESSREIYEELCMEQGIETAGKELPALHVEGNWLRGTEEIAEGTEELLEKVLVESDKASGEEEGRATAEKDSSKETTAEKRGKNLTELPEDLQQAWKTEKPLAVLFSTYSCEDCAKVKAYLKEVTAGQELEVLEYSIAEADNVQLLKEWFGMYQVESEKQQVPILFYGETARSGVEEIEENLEDDLAEGAADPSLMKKYVEEHRSTMEEEKLPNLWVLFAAGLLAGFNPCSISMLLMLFSLILTAQASVKKNGLLYLAGKYITYVALGLGIYFAAAWATGDFLERLMQLVKNVLAALFLFLAFMNFLDFLNVRKGEFGKVHMQLPKGLRRWNHEMIKKVGGISGRMLPLLVLGLGILISVGEFFCTGQIYMASILYMLKQESGAMIGIVLAFLVYVTAMSIPAVVFLVIIAKTRSTNRISEFMLRRMELVKLLNSVLFVCFALYFLIFG